MRAPIALTLTLLISLGGCHLLFPFDSGGPPAVDAPPAPRDGAPMHRDALLPLDSVSDDVPFKPDTIPPPPDATVSPDLPCSKQPELCNGYDDNCNGKVDEGLTQPCFTGPSGCIMSTGGSYSCKGLCKAGSQTCNNGIWSACSGQIVPQAEICNNLDDNCNDKVDEGLTQPCFTGPSGCIMSTGGSYSCKGLCKDGVLTCAAGKWGPCTGEVTPEAEKCNNKDDDCDGQTDEEAVCPNFTDVCKNGVCQ